MSDRPPREAPISVRLPEELRNWIADQAAREERSFSAQIVWLLERGRELVAPARDGALAGPERHGAQGDPATGRSAALDAAPSHATPPGPASARPFQTDFKEPAKKKERRR